jgi:Cupin-like domain
MKHLTELERADWITWITRNLLRNITSEMLAETMFDYGFSKQQSAELIQVVVANPVFQGAKSLAWRVANLEALLDVKQSLLKLDCANDSVDRREKLSSEEFLTKYYSQNKPVIITDVVSRWSAFTRWSLPYFRTKFGEVMVDVQSNRKPFPVYEVFLKGHTERMRLGDFIDLMEEGESGNRYYLTANDRLLENPEIAPLLQDFWPFPEYFKCDDRTGKQFLWLGPKGSLSPLHRDRLNVFMTQVSGYKRIKLISSNALHLVYNFESFFSEVDVEHPDLERYPLFAKAAIMDVTLGPGDALLIPVGWWHHVRSLENSINVSMTNFLFPNNFEGIYQYYHG